MIGPACEYTPNVRVSEYEESGCEFAARCRCAVAYKGIFKDVKWSYHWYSIGGSVLEQITKDPQERSRQTAP